MKTPMLSVYLLASLAMALFGQTPVVSSVLDSASYSLDLAPGSLATLFGADLAATTAIAPGIPLPVALDGVSVQVSDGTASRQAPLWYISPTQINFQMPYEVQGSNVTIQVLNGAKASASQAVTLSPQAPKLFSVDPSGSGDAIVTHADGSFVSATSPAAEGETVIAYVIGLGAVAPPLASGAPAGDGGALGPLNRSAAVSVLIDNQPAAVTFAGLTPQSVGLGQINFQMPAPMSVQRADIVLQGGTKSSQTLSLAVRGTGQPHEYFVSTGGSKAGDGSKGSPWDLVTALNHPAVVKPGDTIWLRGGVYGSGTTLFQSQLTGSVSNPIIVRQYPGEQATINGGLFVNGPNTWYWGFEVMSSLTDRTGDQYNPTSGIPDGVDTNGPNTKFINLIVHDTREGFGVWMPAANAEVYGCLIYHNGWQGPDRGHGHGIYTQNISGVKHLGDNIIFNQFGEGIQGYGTSNATVRGYLVDRNIIFNNGVISRDGRDANIVFGYTGSLSNIQVLNNHFYDTPSADIGVSYLGSGTGGSNRDLVARGNWFIGGYIALGTYYWDSVEFTGNTLYSMKSINTTLSLTEKQSTAGYKWGNNTYYGAGSFYFNSSRLNWSGWSAATGLDLNSKWTAAGPSGIWSFAYPNKYEPGRGHIVVYNWDNSDTVTVDVSSILKPGAAYEVRDAESFFASPVLSGNYDGNPITLPMTGLKVVQPTGSTPTSPQHTAPQLGVFVVLPR